MLALQFKTPTPASPAFPVAPFAQLESSTLVATQAQPWELDSLIQLDFSELRSFEVVCHQYQQWGIEFDRTIALQPSNPAFDDPAQLVGLMPIAHPCMSVQFHQSRQLIEATLVGSRAIMVTAFDAKNQVLMRYELPRQLAGGALAKQPDTKQPKIEASLERPIPQHTLNLQAEAIARIELTSAAPFILQRFCCI